MAQVHDKERELTREVSQTVDAGPSGRRGARRRALRAASGSRSTSTTRRASTTRSASASPNLLRGYLDRYTVDVSSPGIERPLRTPATSATPSAARSPCAPRPRSAGASASAARWSRPTERAGARRRGQRARDHPVRGDRAGQPDRRRALTDEQRDHRGGPDDRAREGDRGGHPHPRARGRAPRRLQEDPGSLPARDGRARPRQRATSASSRSSSRRTSRSG